MAVENARDETLRGVKQMNENDYQPMPSQGKLYENLNLSRKALWRRINKFQHDEVRSYIVTTTTEDEQGRLRQCGSGPNFQGGMITLSSCMHRMRTSFIDIESWKGVWVAGFTNFKGRQVLFYLMRVSQAFQSQRGFWFSESIPRGTKKAKAAHLSKFGDIYKPKGKSATHYSYREYLGPCEDHVHSEPRHWHKDINYRKGYSQRKPALLVGNPEVSFLWDRPVIRLPFESFREQKKTRLSCLFDVK